jgi:hypothetical protein
MIVCGMLTVAGTGGSWRLLLREPGIGSIFLMVCGLEMLAVTAAVLIAL